MARGKQKSAAKNRGLRQAKPQVAWWKRPLTWVGGILTAAIVAVATAFGTGAEQRLWPSGGSEKSPSTEINSVNNGKCIAQGSGNKVVCVTPTGTASLGNVTVSWPTSLGGEYIYLGASSQLSRPPDYPTEAKSSHCHNWQAWMQGQSKVYPVGATSFMDLISGSPDLVVVTNVKVNVFSRIPLPPTYTLIQCSYGAGGVGYKIRPNVITRQTEVTDDRTNKEFVMPPGSLHIAGADFEATQITIVSRPNDLYQGSIEVDALVNGKPYVVKIGTVSNPVRWIEPSTIKPRHPHPYDWDVKKQAWVNNFNPFGGQLTGS